MKFEYRAKLQDVDIVVAPDDKISSKAQSFEIVAQKMKSERML